MFRFKQFSIDDAHCGMPVSTDGVLLGAWASAPQQGRLLDIGCGSGLLSLMLAQRYDGLAITALDIEESAVKATQKNRDNSPWCKRIFVIQANIIQWAYTQQAGSFDVIVCNPPYFTSGEIAQNKARGIARHTQRLDFLSLMRVTQYLLKPQAVAHFILPILQASQCIALAQSIGLHLVDSCMVKSTDNKPPFRHLFSLSPCLIAYREEKELRIKEKGVYSDDYVALTQDFYLKM